MSDGSGMRRGGDLQPRDNSLGDMRTLSQWIGAAIISFYPKVKIGDIRITFTDVTVNRIECAAKIRNAVGRMCIGGKQFASLSKRIRRIVVWPGDRNFADDTGAIHLAASDLIEIGELALASLLVHEAVHLRLSALGIAYVPAYRERIERLCIATQARFLRTSPGDGDEMAREAEAVLETRWWTRETREVDLERLFDEHRVPKWLRAVVPRT